MHRSTSFVPSYGGLVGAFALALIAGSVPTASVASVPHVVPASTVLRAGVARPDTCSAKEEAVKTAGGVFKVPPCAGTTGKVSYGPNNAPSDTTATLLTSATNPDPSACGSTHGETPVAYLQSSLTGSGSVSFASTKKKSTLKNVAFPTSSTFTLVAYAFGIVQFSEPLGHPNAKHTLSFASPLNGLTLPLGVTFCFELDTP